MTYGYIRVSSDKQTVENQRFEIEKFCTSNHLHIDGWIEETISGKVLAFAFGLSAEIERNLISQRTKEALARKKSEEVQLGRPKGKISAQETYKLHRKERLIRDLRAEGVSFAKIGNILKVNRDTVRRYYHTFLEEKK